MYFTNKVARIGFIALSLLLVAALLAIALPQKAQAATDPGAFSVALKNGKINLTTSGYSGNHKFKVRVRDGTASKGGFKDVGMIKVPKKVSSTFSFAIPKTLAKTLYLQICLKDQTSNTLNCKTVVNPGT